MKTRAEVATLLGLSAADVETIETKLASDLTALTALTTRANRIYAFGRAVDDDGQPVPPKPETPPNQ